MEEVQFISEVNFLHDKMIEYQPTTYKCSSLDHKMRETCKYILLL